MEQKDSDSPIAKDESAPPPPSSTRIPVIKIKIQRKAEEETPPAEEAKSHYCKECNKSFNSGKALGGHMSSAHVQANKDYSFKKLSSKRKSPGSYLGSTAISCMLCGRVFQSKKSLFGHMRCHPEREWRGMEPPPEMKIDSDEEEEEIAELGFFNPKGWPTSKRGRGPVSSNRADSGLETKEAESVVAEFELMKMLKDNDDDERREMKGKEKEDEKSAGAIDPTDELYVTAIEVLASGKRERVKGEMETTSSLSPEKYKCNECNRVFSTHQALGGHRSSHNKFKMTVVNTSSSDQLSQVKSKKKKKKKKKNIVNSNAAAAGNGAAFPFDLNMAPVEEEDIDDSSKHISSNS